MPRQKPYISSVRRRRLRRYLFEAFGDGSMVPCAACDTPLEMETFTIGHWPIPHCLGGPTTLSNTRPECYDCNHEDGDRVNQLMEKHPKDVVKQMLLQERLPTSGPLTVAISSSVGIALDEKIFPESEK